jgi:uncharacterized protein (DUF885 family)
MKLFGSPLSDFIAAKMRTPPTRKYTGLVPHEGWALYTESLEERTRII